MRGCHLKALAIAEIGEVLGDRFSHPIPTLSFAE